MANPQEERAALNAWHWHDAVAGGCPYVFRQVPVQVSMDELSNNADVVCRSEGPQMSRDARAQIVVLFAERGRRVAPVGVVVEPDWMQDEFRRFPFIAGPDVRMNKRVGVAKDVEVGASKLWVRFAAGVFDCGGEEVGVSEELDAFVSWHIGQRFRPGVFSEKDAVSGEELDVADYGVAALEFSEDRGVLSSCC